MMKKDWLHVSLCHRLCSSDRSFCDPCGSFVVFGRRFWKHPTHLSMNAGPCPWESHWSAHRATNYQPTCHRVSDVACPVRFPSWRRDSAESDELHWQMLMTRTTEDLPREQQTESTDSSKNGYVRFGVSFWNLPWVIESCSLPSECSQSIVYSNWFETDSHIRSIDTPRRRWARKKPRGKRTRQLISDKHDFYFRPTVFGSVLLPPRRSYSRTSRRSTRMGDLRILLIVNGAPRLNWASLLPEFNDDEVDPDGLFVPLRLPPLVIRSISVNR